MIEPIAPPAPGRRPHPAAFIQGLPITCAPREYILGEIGRAIEERETGHFVAVTNPENMYHGLRIPSIGEYIRNSDFSVCDGVGVIVAGLAWGHRVPRFSGPTLQLECSRQGIAKGWRHFYYGGKPGVADEMARRLKQKYPGLIVCGTYCPPFGELSAEEDARVIETINAARPDIVWVGLGVPAKERWIAAHLGKLEAPWLIGVGAAFDYHSGAIPWAPAPIRAVGMEWLYRLIIEPKMRARRTWWHLIYVVQTFLNGLLAARFLHPAAQARQGRHDGFRIDITGAQPMIRVALLGFGKMGLSHCAIINTHPDVKLVAVCDTTEYLLDVLGKYSHIKTYSNYRKLLAAEQLNAVFIATPSRFHAEMVRSALDAGLHVFCEKPFCLDAAEGLRLAELAEEKKLVNQVGYHYRFVGAFQEMKRLLDAGVLGTLHHIRGEAYGPVVLRPKGKTWRTNKVEGGGCLYDYASHAIDLINHLVGRPQTVGETVMNRLFSADVEDEVYSNFFYPSGLSGQISANWSDESYRKMSTKITVWGTNGKIAADRQELQIYLRDETVAPGEFNKGWNTRYTTELTEPVWFYLRGEEYSAQINHFVEAIKEGRGVTRSTFRSAVDTDMVAGAMTRDVERKAATAARVEVMPVAAPAAPGFMGALLRPNPRNRSVSA